LNKVRGTLIFEGGKDGQCEAGMFLSIPRRNGIRSEIRFDQLLFIMPAILQSIHLEYLFKKTSAEFSNFTWTGKYCQSSLCNR
jgi:hypothetical protein